LVSEIIIFFGVTRVSELVLDRLPRQNDEGLHPVSICADATRHRRAFRVPVYWNIDFGSVITCWNNNSDLSAGAVFATTSLIDIEDKLAWNTVDCGRKASKEL
jgi:hypothetical protein